LCLQNNNNAHVKFRSAQQLAAVLLLLVSASAASAGELRFLETENLQIVYYDPYETYLVPHVTQSFLSALASQRRLFDYVPDGKVSVYLRDFSDVSNAFATPVPRNSIFFDIAAGYDPYETVSSGDWYFTTALHETTHLADNDRAAPVDARFRRLFHGKVNVEAAQPETLLYFYLTVPRRTGKGAPFSWRPG
jgi:hypothetical protein